MKTQQLSKKTKKPLPGVRGEAKRTQPPPPLTRVHWGVVALSLTSILASMTWAYFPNFQEMVHLWDTVPDYSHGFLVLPLTLGILYARRDTMPAVQCNNLHLVLGISIVAVGIMIRLFASRYFYTPIENWSIIVILIGFCWATLGWRVATWAAPAILFLIFAMPLPFSVETAMRQPLRGVATEISTATLILFDLPALAEANTIRVNDEVYGVDEACSGLRIFWAVAAFAYGIAMLAKTNILVRGLLLLSVVPVALVANSSRIVATCLAFEWGDSTIDKQWWHDTMGFAMIPYAILLLLITLWVLGRVFPTQHTTKTAFVASS